MTTNMSASSGEDAPDDKTHAVTDGLNADGSFHLIDQENGIVPPSRPDRFVRQAHLTETQRVGGILPLDGD